MVSADHTLPGLAGESQWVLCLSDRATHDPRSRAGGSGTPVACRVSSHLRATTLVPGLASGRGARGSVAHPHPDAARWGEREAEATLGARTTDSLHGESVASNRLERQFTVTAPNRVWGSDIKYLTHKTGGSISRWWWICFPGRLWVGRWHPSWRPRWWRPP